MQRLGQEFRVVVLAQSDDGECRERNPIGYFTNSGRRGKVGKQSGMSFVR